MEDGGVAGSEPGAASGGIDAVGFDLDYTLAVPERDRTAILLDALASVGLDRDAVDDPRAAYLQAHGDHLESETRAPVFRAMLSEAGVTVTGPGEDGSGPEDGATVDPVEAARAYRERIADALVPVPGALGLVRKLREGYRVGLLTDGPAVAQRDKLATLGWTDAFDAVLISGELGVGKPDRRAFAALCAALRADPSRVVYVGDDPVRDVRGASEAGLLTVQVLGPGDEPDERADATLRRDELAARLPDVLRELGREIER